MKKILLIQFRTDITTSHEKDCFLKFFKGEKKIKLKIINAFDEKINFSDPERFLKKTQGVILGGSSQFYLSKLKEDKILKKIIKKISPLIKFIIKKDFPTLGICFGHQILGYFLGEKIIADKNQAQTGSFLVFLTKKGKKSPLFLNLPPKFLAQFAHKDSLSNLPKGAELLAKTKKCKVASFQYKNNIYGVQFHPELNYRDMIFRLKLYPEYLNKDLSKMKKKFTSTPLASKIIKNFINKIC